MKKIEKISLKDLSILSEAEMKSIRGGYDPLLCFGTPYGASSGSAASVCGNPENIKNKVGPDGTFCCGCWQAEKFCS